MTDIMRCTNCQNWTKNEEMYNYQDQILCEDCYIQALEDEEQTKEK